VILFPSRSLQVQKKKKPFPQRAHLRPHKMVGTS
jgi:hypothetical protein